MSHICTVTLAEPVPQRLSGELAKRVFFISEAIEDFALEGIGEGPDKALTTVRLTTTVPMSPELLAGKLDRMIAADILPQRHVRPHVVWRSSHSGTPHTKVFDELLARGVVTASGEGQFSFTDPFTGLMDHLDKLVRDIASSLLPLREHNYPTLIPTHVLARSGYLRSFPQLLLFVERLHGDLDTYEAFLDGVADRTDGADSARAVADALTNHGTHSGYTLSPAVCYHAYQQHTGTALAEPLLTLSARGTCYRHESRYHHSLERLWEFTMREIILIGSQEAVAEQRRVLMESIFALIDDLGLEAHCEAASDPFFCSPGTAQKVWSQRLLELKYELVLPVGDNSSVAAASFNVHGQTLAEAFDITAADGTIAATGCMAFGLERLAYAFLCRHGVDPEGWPDEVAHAVSGAPGAVVPGGKR
ncbi:hypothetical protein [Streptomyces chartreusis]|uniref:hypothetical protein n=1 Tax=Streptomyces chartreusis TaxID=1969 RepID=UPI0033B534C5